MSNAFNFGSFGNFTQPSKKKGKKHAHSQIKDLEKQMKKGFFWTAKPNRMFAINIVDRVMRVRKRKR